MRLTKSNPADLQKNRNIGDNKHDFITKARNARCRRARY